MIDLTPFMGIGLLVPLVLEVWEAAPAMTSRTPLHYNRGLAALTGVLIIFGGYVLRYVFVYAGQISYFR